MSRQTKYQILSSLVLSKEVGSRAGTLIQKRVNAPAKYGAPCRRPSLGPGRPAGRARARRRGCPPDPKAAAEVFAAEYGLVKPYLTPIFQPKNAELVETRSLLYRSQISQPNTHFAAFFEIYKINILLHRFNLKILQKFSQTFFRKMQKNVQIFHQFRHFSRRF